MTGWMGCEITHRASHDREEMTRLSRAARSSANHTHACILNNWWVVAGWLGGCVVSGWIGEGRVPGWVGDRGQC